jgi:hypothetical protein
MQTNPVDNLTAHIASTDENQRNRYERAIAENEKLPFKFRFLLAILSRVCRLNSLETDPDRRVIWDTATNVIAPVVFGFVHWCLLEAQRKGIQRLYFVARDGQILWQVAQVICREWGYPIDCRYLYGSRQAFYFPALQQIGEAELDWIFQNTDILSVRIICERVNLQPEQIETILSKSGFPQETWDEHLTAHKQRTLKQVFQTQEVIDAIIKLAAVYREKAVGYLKQEGIGDGTAFAIVDVGWTGRSQRAFSQLINIAGLYPQQGVQGFYFGLIGFTPSRKAFSTDHLDAYFLAPDFAFERRLLCKPEMIELFLAADHGSTVRYEQYGNQYIPILRSEKNESGLQWGLLVQHQAIINFAEKITAHINPDDCRSDDFCCITEHLLKLFTDSPTKEEADVFGSLRFSQHQSENIFYELAPVYRFADSLKMLLDKHYLHRFVWVAAANRRSHFLAKIPLTCLNREIYSFMVCEVAWAFLHRKQYKQAASYTVRAFSYNPSLLFSRKFIHLSLLILSQSLSRSYL